MNVGMIYLFLILWSIFALAPVYLFGANNSAKTNPSTTTVKKTLYDVKRFDLTTQMLQSNYGGHDIQKVYLMLKKQFPEKSDFETKDAYMNRLQSFASNDLYAFSMKIDCPDEQPIKSCSYDADDQTLTVRLNASSYYVNSSSWKKNIAITTKSTEKQLGKYEGTNAFGAKAIIKKSKYIDYGICLANEDEGIRQWITINLPPDKARLLHKNLGVLLIGKLKTSGDPPSYTFLIHDYRPPSLDSPYEFSTTRHFIFLELEEIWVYNIKSGEVLAKEKP